MSFLSLFQGTSRKRGMRRRERSCWLPMFRSHKVGPCFCWPENLAEPPPSRDPWRGALSFICRLLTLSRVSEASNSAAEAARVPHFALSRLVRIELQGTGTSIIQYIHR